MEPVPAREFTVAVEDISISEPSPAASCRLTFRFEKKILPIFGALDFVLVMFTVLA